MQRRRPDSESANPRGELDLIRRIRARAALTGGSALRLGIGDDCALLRPRPGEEIAVRESSKNNSSILASREATAHAPSPSWMDVDRENLKGKINSIPRRDELVQIPINEQLIVELYSK